jgi:hypothetical protein
VFLDGEAIDEIAGWNSNKIATNKKRARERTRRKTDRSHRSECR